MDPHPHHPRRVRWGALLRILVPTALAAVVAGALWIMPDAILTLPRQRRVAVIETLLRAVSVGYFGLLATGVVGTPLFAVLAFRAWRLRRPRAWLGRLTLLCWGSLVALVGAEFGATVWSAWAHRMPALPTTFAPSESPGERRIVVLGESSAAGDPFHEWLSIGKLIAWQLEAAAPAHKAVADVLAERGVTLERMHQKLETLKYKPDAIVVYCGHNEFQARFDWGRRVDVSEEPPPGPLRLAYAIGRLSPLCRFLSELITKARLDAPPNIGKHDLIDPPICSPSEYEAIRDDFERRLDAIAVYGQKVGAEMILVIPPGNEAGWEPNRSSLPLSTSPAARAEAARTFEEARAAEEADPSRSAAAYRKLVAAYPDFAEAQFRLARVLQRQGDFTGANRHYERARDADSFPQRCPTPFQDAYRRVAARRGCLLIDGPAEMRALNRRGLLDDSLFLDAQHPNLPGHVRLAQAVLREIARRGLLGWPSHRPPPELDPAVCAAHFGMTRGDWAPVVRSAAWFARVTSANRFDPAERMAEQARLLEAGDAIDAGAEAEAVGVPGLGAHPRFEADPDWARKSKP